MIMFMLMSMSCSPSNPVNVILAFHDVQTITGKLGWLNKRTYSYTCCRQHDEFL